MANLPEDRLMRRWWTCGTHYMYLLAPVVLLTACSLQDLVGKTGQDSYVTDPNAVKDKAGAIARYNSVPILFTAMMGRATLSPPSYIFVSGVLSDELKMNTAPFVDFPSVYFDQLDSRTVAGAVLVPSSPYSALHEVRGRAVEGIGALRKYASDMPTSYVGYLYALKAYAELLLAEFYCSGIPLSEPVFEGDFYYTPGYSRDSVMRHAVALFDTAATLATDSARILHLIRVGKGRALLSLGEYALAGAAVKEVPTDYEYALQYSSEVKKWGPSATGNVANMADNEGGNGEPYRSSGDPRLALPRIRDSLASLPVATGVEARLIEAETALQTAGETPAWLKILNALRTTCTDALTCPSPAPAGTGGIAGLPPLTDPGTRDTRIDLVFQERAYWMYLTGHRQGDLRRLVRVYGRPQGTVYPVGGWGREGITAYGQDISSPVPATEQQYNPLFQGCRDD